MTAVAHRVAASLGLALALVATPAADEKADTPEDAERPAAFGVWGRA